MKYALIFILLFFFTACNESKQDTSNDSSQKNSMDKQQKTNASQELFVLYESWTSKVKVENGKLFYSKTEYQYDNPVSATPSSSTVNIIFDNISLEQKTLDEIIQKIMLVSFFDLEKTMYGAGEGERYYPYSIKVKLENREKEVLYHSNPSSEKAPTAFALLEEYLTTELIILK